MPTYSYRCMKCDHVMQVFHSMTAKPRVKCEKCGSTRMKRMLGTGAGIIFKGSGFYETDYKNKGKGKTGQSSSSSETKSEKKSESSSTKKDGGSKSKSSEAA